MKLKKGKLLGAILLSIFFLSSCRSLKNTNTLFQSEYDKFANTANSIYIVNDQSDLRDNSYRIKPYDQLALRNLQNMEGLTSTTTIEGGQPASMFKVDSAGAVTLPVIGLVEVLGLNTSEAAKKIQRIYGTSLLKNPIIEVSVVNLKVTLMGDVNKQGNYQLEHQNTTLIDILGQSGGLMPSADVSRIKIIRGSFQDPKIIYVNLKNLKTLSSNELTLHHNDIIYIPTRQLYSVSEGVKNYSGIMQAAFLVLNVALLIYTIGR